MPAHRGNTPDRILAAAREIFLQRGYSGASIQQIADAVGISAPGIYKHFGGKDALFSALVEPMIAGMREIMGLAEAEKDALFRRDRAADVWDKAAAYAQALDFIYDHFADMKLLVCRAAGTPYENIVDRIADRESDVILRTLPQLREKGMPVPEIDPETIRLMMRHQYRTCVEFIYNDCPRPEAERYLETVNAFFTAGWRQLLEF